MDLVEIIKEESLHHAYCVEGDMEIAREELLGLLESSLGFPIKGNPDFWHAKHENFGIEDARSLSSEQLRRPIREKRKIFVIEFSSITHEAQNALLKMFEEPVSHTHFFIIVEKSDVLLLTLQSRLFFVKVLGQRKSIKNNFLQMTLPERLSYVKDMADGLKDEKIRKAEIVHFVEDLEKEIYKMDKDLEGRALALEQIVKAESYIKDRSSSVKQILEHLAITLPVI